MAVFAIAFVSILLINIFNCFGYTLHQEETNENVIKIESRPLETKTFAIWPNGTVPFYVNENHFESQQLSAIMRVVSRFMIKTCITFAPVMDPAGVQHLLVFENPDGIRKCTFNRHGHDAEGPHTVVLGYDCLTSPNIDMMIMRALGFPFEHNRALRDIFIDIQFENIEPDALHLFNKDHPLPLELQRQPYDPNSVMHFDVRDFSKNGHRTIIFKNEKFKQNRQGLTEDDIKKINIVYGDECVKREREEHIEDCKKFFGISRGKRDTEYLRRSLRVNPDIPPPEIEKLLLDAPSERIMEKVKEFELEIEIEDIIEKIYNATRKAVKHIKNINCNTGVKPTLRSTLHFTSSKPETFGLIDKIINFVNETVNSLAGNLTEFCKKDDEFEIFLRTQVDGLKKIDTKDNVDTLIKSTVVEKERKKRETNESRFIKTTEMEDPFDDKTRRLYENKLKYNKHKNEGNLINMKERNVNQSSSSDDTHIEIKPGMVISLTDKNEEFYADRRWPNNIVPYVISKHVSDSDDVKDLRKRINEVNRILKKKTCVRLKEITESEATEVEDYLVLNDKPDYVTGRVGGRQEFGAIELFSNEEHRQYTAMMVMAMLGFYFENSRHDRDQYIRVHHKHIRPDKLHHFEKITEDATLPLPYDYASATHPAWKFWRKTNQKGISSVATLKSKDPNGKIMKTLGQNQKLLSDIDIIKINSVYKCKTL